MRRDEKVTKGAKFAVLIGLTTTDTVYRMTARLFCIHFYRLIIIFFF